MADYCDKCADELGFEKESYPLLCEGCGKYFEETNLIKSFLKWLNRKIKNL